MKTGIVTGCIWATRKADGLQRQTFLTVDLGEGQIVASDQVGAGVGDRVLVVTGTTAARYCMEAPIDAVVVAILDEKEGA